MTTTITTGTCGKCDGVGRMNWCSHVMNGVCFWCKGTGRVTVKEYSAPEKRGPELPSKTIDLPSLSAKAHMVKVGDTLHVTVYVPGEDVTDLRFPGGNCFIDLPAARQGRLEVRGITCGLTDHKKALLADLGAALKR